MSASRPEEVTSLYNTALQTIAQGGC